MDIKPERFLADLRELRTFGACGTGVIRPAFSDADIAARRWYADRCTGAGLEARIDSAGNVWGLAAGRGILTGSHTDTQPEGGWLDGALGTIAGLEVARAAREAGGPPISAVSFQDEEGRFGALTGSDIWSGRLTVVAADGLRADDGATFGDARRGLPSTGKAPSSTMFTGFIELHIEQGPVLDTSGETLGVVTDIVGARQMTVRFAGEQNHAGTTPMRLRRDAVTGFAAFHAELKQCFGAHLGADTVWTIGQVDVRPNASSVVPGEVRFTVQWRDPSEARLSDMEAAARAAVTKVAAAHHLEASISDAWALSPAKMDARLVDACAGAAEGVAPGRWRRMISGAIHDARNVARLMPSAMLFVPSIGGVSHTFDEDTREKDLVAGLRALAAAAAQISG
ncbi:MAG: hydantoinase/carbamoylase family amidase [Pseudomonadota bacterium]